MSLPRRIDGWPARLLLVPSTLVFFGIAARHLLHPSGAAATEDIALVSPLGQTVFRAGSGGFPLACALGLLTCLCSRERVIVGLAFAELVVCTVLAVRIGGMLHDGTVAASRHLVIAEIVLAALTGLGIVIETIRIRIRDRRAGRTN